MIRSVIRKYDTRIYDRSLESLNVCVNQRNCGGQEEETLQEKDNGR